MFQNARTEVPAAAETRPQNDRRSRKLKGRTRRTSHDVLTTCAPARRRVRVRWPPQVPTRSLTV